MEEPRLADADKAMAERICMVTGATSGIGAAIAFSLARKGAVVIVIGRNERKCAAMVGKIRRAAANPKVEYIVADLAIQRDIHRLVARFRTVHARLDVLINNAGARFDSRIETPDGLEMSFALNHLGYFILTDLLLEDLKAGGHGRIVNVSSGAHTSCPGIDFDDLQSRNRYDGRAAYAQSKLANILFTYELARRLAGTGITANALEPGNVMSNFSRNNGWISWARHILGSLKAGNLVGPAEGAKPAVYLASAPGVAEISGKYFSGLKAVRSSDASYDAAAARRLWNVSLHLVQPVATFAG